MLLSLVAGSASLPVAASPWLQEPGKTYLSTAAAQGRVGTAGTLDYQRGDVYAEYGAAKNWTLTGKIEAVRYADASEFDSAAWRLTARRQLLSAKAFVISAEFGALQGAAIGGEGGCNALGAEARIGAAWSGKWRKTETYAYGDIGGRVHAGCERVIAETGLGQKLTGPIWIVTQVFYEDGRGAARSVKNQTFVMWKAEAYEIGLGYREEIGGDFEEDAAFLSFARRF